MNLRDLADEWIAAWNARDLERVLSHYGDDVVMTSPIAAQVVPESDGTISGKDALRSYWTLALSRNPDLHFDLVDVLDTAHGCTILYRNQRAQLVGETLLVGDDGLVHRAIAAYAAIG